MHSKKYSTSFTDIPYKADKVNHATKYKMANIPYKAGTVNHAMKNEMVKNTDIPYKAGMVNHASRLKRRRLLTYFGTWLSTWLWYGMRRG